MNIEKKLDWINAHIEGFLITSQSENNKLNILFVSDWDLPPKKIVANQSRYLINKSLDHFERALSNGANMNELFNRLYEVA